MKVRVNILLEKEIAEKAHELGINISKVSENALKQYIQALGNVRFMKQDDFLSPGSSAEESGTSGVGFEPTTTNLGGWCSVRRHEDNTHDHELNQSSKRVRAELPAHRCVRYCV